MPDPSRALQALRAEAVQRLATLIDQFAEVVASSRDTNADDEHDPEGATIAFERSQVGALAGQTRERVTEIDEALARLAAGTFGTCEVCGLPIEAERLEARPTARTHVRCVGG